MVWVEEINMDSVKVQSIIFAGCFAFMLAVIIFTPAVDLEARIIWAANITALACVYIIAIAGLDLHTGRTGIVNFGVVFFVGIGSVTSGVLVGQQKLDPLLVMGIAVIISFVIGYLLSYPTIRLRADYLAIVTIILGEILRIMLTAEPYLQDRRTLPGSAIQGLKNVQGPYGWISRRITTLGNEFVDVSNWVGNWLQSSGISNSVGTWLQSSSLFTQDWELLSLPLARVTVAILFTIIVIVILALVYNSPYGRIIKAIREDEDVVEMYGYYVFQIKAIVLGIGAAIMAVAGTLLIWQTTNTGPASLRPLLTFLIWGAFIIGGGGNLRGSVAGGFVLTLSINVLANSEIQRTIQDTGIGTIHRFFIVDIYEWIDNIFSFIIGLFTDIEEEPLFGESSWTFFWSSDIFLLTDVLASVFLGLLIIAVLLFAEQGLIPERLYRPKTPVMEFSNPIFEGYDEEKEVVSEMDTPEIKVDHRTEAGSINRDMISKMLQRET